MQAREVELRLDKPLDLQTRVTFQGGDRFEPPSGRQFLQILSANLRCKNTRAPEFLRTKAVNMIHMPVSENNLRDVSGSGFDGPHVCKHALSAGHIYSCIN